MAARCSNFRVEELIERYSILNGKRISLRVGATRALLLFMLLLLNSCLFGMWLNLNYIYKERLFANPFILAKETHT